MNIVGLRQYTFFKKDYPFRSPMLRLSEPEADIYVFTIKTPRPLNYLT